MEGDILFAEADMKRSEELRQLLRQRPFQPFRVHLADGRVFDVPRSDMTLVGETFFVIGYPEVNVPDPFADDWVILEMADIQRIEPGLAATAAR